MLGLWGVEPVPEPKHASYSSHGLHADWILHHTKWQKDDAFVFAVVHWEQRWNNEIQWWQDIVIEVIRLTQSYCKANSGHRWPGWGKGAKIDAQMRTPIRGLVENKRWPWQPKHGWSTTRCLQRGRGLPEWRAAAANGLPSSVSIARSGLVLWAGQWERLGKEQRMSHAVFGRQEGWWWPSVVAMTHAGTHNRFILSSSGNSLLAVHLFIFLSHLCISQLIKKEFNGEVAVTHGAVD